MPKLKKARFVVLQGDDRIIIGNLVKVISVLIVLMIILIVAANLIS